jgi:hypothetical protein
VALSAALDPANPQRTPTHFIDALDDVARIAPSFRALRAATGRWRQPQPADWIDALLDCRGGAIALIESGETPAGVRRDVADARKAQLEPITLLPALVELRNDLVHIRPVPSRDQGDATAQILATSAGTSHGATSGRSV